MSTLRRSYALFNQLTSTIPAQSLQIEVPALAVPLRNVWPDVGDASLESGF